MYTYVQRRGCKKENTATYVHTGSVSNAYSRIRTWLYLLSCTLAIVCMCTRYVRTSTTTRVRLYID